MTQYLSTSNTISRSSAFFCSRYWLLLPATATEASGGTLSPEPLLWALAMGAGFGGNATPIGSSANVMTVAISERSPYPIMTKEWVRAGFPVMIITCVVATVFMYFFHGALYT